MKKFLLVLMVLICLLMIYTMVNNLMTPDNIGVIDGRLSVLPTSPNAVSSQVKNDDRYVAPLKFIKDLHTSKEKILRVIKANDRMEIMAETSHYIHVVFTSKLMQFKDDVEFYFDEEDQVIHFRSASRIGYSDMGANLARYEMIKNEYEK